jgi:hypothetical protein
LTDVQNINGGYVDVSSPEFGCESENLASSQDIDPLGFFATFPTQMDVGGSMDHGVHRPADRTLERFGVCDVGVDGVHG